jgi:multidrug efflux pump subunit AcrA (membrane-fusion protein)
MIFRSTCILITSIFLCCCSKKQETTTAKRASITESVYASGIVKSRNQYQVYASVGGIIETMMVKEGDTVKKGDPLFKLLNETAQLNIDNARLAAENASLNANANKLQELKINIDLAKSKRDNDQLLMQRQEKLWAQNIGSRNELDQRILAYKNSSDNYQASILRYNELKRQIDFSSQQSQKNLQISKAAVKDLIIRSERNGILYSLLKEQGEMVNPQTAVAIIGDATSFLVEMQVDEYDIARIRIGQEVLLQLDSYKGQVYQATVSRIYPIMNEKTRAFVVDATFVTRPPELYPNLSAEANIVLQQKKDALIIPRNYLVDDEFVFVKKEKRKVTIGLKDYQKVEILSGLTADDVIYLPSE